MNPTTKVTWTRDVGNMLKPALVSCSTTSTTLYPIAEPFLPDDISVGRGGGGEGRVQPTVIPSQGDWPPEVSRALWEGADSLPASQSQAREPKPISMDSGLPHPNR
jgi:hypothetical protein